MRSAPRFDLRAWSAPRAAAVEGFLAERFADAWPPRFQEACRYPLGTGGKRYRPLLLWAAGEAVAGEAVAGEAVAGEAVAGEAVAGEAVAGAPRGALIAAGAALELVHTYSLVHDDLPAMDDDDERRGQPTVHVAYGEGPAVLVGDALLTEAFAVLAAAPAAAEVRVALVAELARAAGHVGMIGGQAADVGMGGPVRDIDALVAVHAGKTGALIRAAARMGGLVAGAEPAALERLDRYGRAVGLAFQLADDVLDETQDEGDDGPPSYVRLLGVDETRRRAEALADEALDALGALPYPDALAALARFTVHRDH